MIRKLIWLLGLSALVGGCASTPSSNPATSQKIAATLYEAGLWSAYAIANDKPSLGKDLDIGASLLVLAVSDGSDADTIRERMVQEVDPMAFAAISSGLTVWQLWVADGGDASQASTALGQLAKGIHDGVVLAERNREPAVRSSRTFHWSPTE